VRCALLPDVLTEREWVAEKVAELYHEGIAACGAAPTAAVLVRRNADAAPMAQALSRRGVAVEVVGLAGLLSVPEVADVAAMLRVAADPTAGAAALRVLTGPRWRLGARDIAALWRRAVQITGTGASARGRGTGQIVEQFAPDADVACLSDAICDPGAAAAYSRAGHLRIVALGRELTAVRSQLDSPLPDLVAEVRRLLGIDTEVRAARPASAGWSGTEHLDAFNDVVADFATRPGARVSALLAFLDTAEQVENGLAPAEITVAADRVQILTVHAAKGLEWQIVAVSHLSGRVFPSTASPRTWLTDAADLPPLLRGDRATVSQHGVPVLDCSTVGDRKALSDRISDHKRSLDQRRTDEERRLLYVAITRAECTLLASGHHWGATESKPRGPSAFLCELKDVIDASAAAGKPCGTVDTWADAPACGDPNPVRDQVIEAMWPIDPAASRRADIDRGAELVAAAISAGAQGDAPADVHGWTADVDALLAERELAAHVPTPPLPTQLSVSTLVELGRDPSAAAQRLHRRLPRRPDSQALLGTAFHEWVQRYFQAEKLFDLDDLPGAVDADRQHREELEELQAAFTVSEWAARTPIYVEVPFDMVIAGRVVRGRIDAVFADENGEVTVVDWKTGEPPSTPEQLQHNAVQLAVYRIAWAGLQGCPVSSVRAAFHYIRSRRTVRPDMLLSAEEVAALMDPPAA